MFDAQRATREAWRLRWERLVDLAGRCTDGPEGAAIVAIARLHALRATGWDADDAPVLTLASVADDDDVFLFFKRM